MRYQQQLADPQPTVTIMEKLDKLPELQESTAKQFKCLEDKFAKFEGKIETAIESRINEKLMDTVTKKLDKEMKEKVRDEVRLQVDEETDRERSYHVIMLNIHE